MISKIIYISSLICGFLLILNEHSMWGFFVLFLTLMVAISFDEETMYYEDKESKPFYKDEFEEYQHYKHMK